MLSHRHAMRVSGSHRPTTAHNEAPAEPVRIEAEGDDWGTAKAALHAQVPEGHELLAIVMER